MERLLGQHLSEILDQYGYDIQLKLFGQEESTTMETLDVTIGRTGAFGEYHHRIALSDLFCDILGHLLGFQDREIVGIADDDAIERIMPDPVLGQYNQVGCQHHDGHQVEVRLVVANNHRWFLEGLSMWVVVRESGARHMIDDKTGLTLQDAVVSPLVLFRSTP